MSARGNRNETVQQKFCWIKLIGIGHLSDDIPNLFRSQLDLITCRENKTEYSVLKQMRALIVDPTTHTKSVHYAYILLSDEKN